MQIKLKGKKKKNNHSKKIKNTKQKLAFFCRVLLSKMYVLIVSLVSVRNAVSDIDRVFISSKDNTHTANRNSYQMNL